MKVFQIGAAGGVGSRLSALLARRGTPPSGMHRRVEQADAVASTGATPVRGDLIADDVAHLARLMSGHDAVVFSAGAHGTGIDQTSLIDGLGLEKAVEAAQLAGISRFILVSAFPESRRREQTTDGFEHYMKVKKASDVFLAASRLEWLIVRPGILLDGPGDGNVTAGLAIQHGDVHRDNVAAFIDAALHTPTLRRVIVELTDGPTPVADAARAMAELSPST